MTADTDLIKIAQECGAEFFWVNGLQVAFYLGNLKDFADRLRSEPVVQLEAPAVPEAWISSVPPKYFPQAQAGVVTWVRAGATQWGPPGGFETCAPGDPNGFPVYAARNARGGK